MQLVRKYLTSGKMEEKQKKALDANKAMQEYATDWYTRRAATGNYNDLLGGDKLQGVLERVNNTVPTSRTMGDKTYYTGALYHLSPGEEADGYHLTGTNEWASRTLNLRSDKPWHEAIGHQIYNELPQFKGMYKVAPRINYIGGYGTHDTEMEDYLNGSDEEKGANIWGFRGANRNMKDANGNLYIDPERLLNGNDVKEMRANGATIPDAFKDTSDEDIAKMHNLYASDSRFKTKDNIFDFA